ncbi:MAG: GAF domain-containing protein, partial [Myxococcales bacterium]
MREMKGGFNPAPPVSGSAYAVQFFLDEALLCDRVADFLYQGLLAGDALVVIATPAHRQTLTAALTTALTARPTDKAAGFDIADLLARRQLVLLDAEEMLTKFMVGDSPDWDRFQQAVEEVLDSSDRSRPRQRLRVYGEMVDVLWKNGNPQAAIRLEEMWNDLVRDHRLDLLHVYVMGSFYMSRVDAPGEHGEHGKHRMPATDGQHHHIEPTPHVGSASGERASGTVNPPTDEALERTTLELAAEIAARKKLEVELRRSIRDRRRTEHEARATAARMAELQNATARMATALDVIAVGEILLSVSERVLGARAGVFYLPDEQGRYCLQATQGVPEAVQEWSVLPLDSSLPLATAITSATPVWIEEYAPRLPVHSKGDATPPQAGPTGDHSGGDLQAVVAMPILQGTRVLGGFALNFGATRKFEEGERRWLESFASQCGVAIERARLYEGEQRARGEAETLFRIAASLNSTQLDRAAIVQCVTDQATAMVGAEVGAFFYNAPNQEGGAELLYTMAGAPAEAFARFGLPRNAPLFNASVTAGGREGEGVIRLDDVTKDPRYGQWGAAPKARPGQLPITSYLAAPLTSRDGTVMGALVFGHSQPGRFSPHHERMLKTLAITAAVSLENANLFSATREADEKHRRSIADLTETVRMNELFAGVLAHDLRNPLASIMTAAQVTLARTADERLTKPMNRILKSGDRMLRMIEQLLDFTRIRVGNGMPINPRELDLVPLLRQVADELKAGAAEASITIRGTGDTNGAWDSDRLAQVFSNLLGNALHHGRPDPDGASPVRVDVQVDGRDRDSIQVLVHNAGTIPAGTGSNLFEPFGSRERPAERTRGLGLGLFITREIVRAHGGSVRVESSENEGTTFSVSLPRLALAVQSPADLSQGRSLQEAQEQLRGSEERIR